MENGRAVYPNISGICQASIGPTPLNQGINPRLNDFPGAMRSGRNSQRRVVRRNRVDVYARGYHGFDYIERRLDMGKSGLAAPRPETRNVSALAHDYRPILMPPQ